MRFLINFSPSFGVYILVKITVVTYIVFFPYITVLHYIFCMYKSIDTKIDTNFCMYKSIENVTMYR